MVEKKESKAVIIKPVAEKPKKATEETKEEEVIHTGTVDTQTDMMPRRIYSYFKEK